MLGHQCATTAPTPAVGDQEEKANGEAMDRHMAKTYRIWRNAYESHDIVTISVSSAWGGTSRALRTTGYVVYMPADGVID